MSRGCDADAALAAKDSLDVLLANYDELGDVLLTTSNLWGNGINENPFPQVQPGKYPLFFLVESSHQDDGRLIVYKNGFEGPTATMEAIGSNLQMSPFDGRGEVALPLFLNATVKDMSGNA